MTNELTNYNAFNLNEEKILELQIKQRPIQTKNNGKQMVIDVLMNIPVYKDVEDENSGLITKTFIGELNRWIGLHFRKDAFDNIPNECNIHKIDDLSTGTLYVRASAVKPPKEYYPHWEDKPEKDWTKEEDAENMKNGTIPQIFVRPQVWIHKDGIVGFIPYSPSQERFTFKPKNESKLIENDADDSTLEDNE